MAATNQTIPDFDDFERYFNGQMSPAEQRLLEGRMLDEPLVADAYEGYLAWRTYERNTAPLHEELTGRLRTRVRKRSNSLPMWAYASAASVFLAIFAYWSFFIDGEKGAFQQPEAVVSREKPDGPAPAAESPVIAQSAKSAQQIISQPASPTPPQHSPETLKSNAAEPVDLGSDMVGKEIAATQQEDIALTDSVKAEALPAQAAPQPSKALTESVAAKAVSKSMAARVKPVTPSSTQFVSEKAADRNETLPEGKSAYHIIVPAEPEAAKKDTNKLATATPSPADGWESYRAYLDKNSGTAAKPGEVVVTFIVGPTGALSGFTAKGPKHLQGEAIRIISKGPAWRPVEINGVAVAATAEIQLQFRHSK